MNRLAVPSFWAAALQRLKLGGSRLGGPRLGQACALAAQVGTFAWLIDAGLTAAAGVPVTPARAIGWAAALGLSVVVLVLGFVILELIGVLPSLRARIASVLSPASSELEHERIAQSSALVALMVALAPVAFLATRSSIIGIATPQFAALVIVAVHGVLGLFFALLWPGSKVLAAQVVARLARSPLAPALATSLRWLGLWLGLGALLALVLAVAFFETVRLLPWHPVLSAGGGVALTALALWLGGHAGRPLRVLGLTALGALALAGVVAMLSMSYAPDAARAALRESVGGRLGHGLAAFALDFDRDGALSVLGGGDCAPFDGHRYPGAIDVPDNRLDEDCDGTDLTRGTIFAHARLDHALPKDFPRKPPVVLLTVDAFAARHLHALSRDPKARRNTPVLDAFAAQGTLFSSCFAQGPSTRLSFPSLFTSRWDSQIEQRLVRIHPFPIESAEVLLAEIMKDAGYETTAVVSDSYFFRSRWGSLLQGFTNVVDSPARVAHGTHNSKAVTDAAIKKLVTKADKPLFLWAHYFDAHPPHKQPKDVTSYGKSQKDLYDAELQAVDKEIGRLLKEIDKKLGKDAVVIVTGDHGIGFDSPRHRRLSYGYDLSTVVLHVPLIVRGPEIKKQVLAGPVSTMDIAPTIANLVRVRKNLPFEGSSLVPELFSGKVERPARLHHQFYLHERLWNNEDPLAMVSVRTDRYNLVLDRKTGVHELYDYVADYQESRDLSGDSAHAKVLATLKQQLALFTYELHAPHRVAAAQLR